jgi:tRNA splicing endonuclease
MTVRMLIKQLLDYPMDYQVLDTDGSPIMYMIHDERKKGVRLEPKSQMDVDAELEALFEKATEESWGDYETYEELLERGYTLRDLKDYKIDTYLWAKQIADEFIED